MLVGQHVFGVTALQQAPPTKARRMRLRSSLHLGHGIRIHACGRVEKHAAGMAASWASASPSPGTCSNTPSTTQTWKCTCSFRLEPNRWIKATAPMCRAALFTSAAPGQLAIGFAQ
jgi:hypothetical protein